MILFQQLFQRADTCTVDMLYRNTVLFGAVFDTGKHLMRAGAREYDQQIRLTDLVFKVRRHLGEDFGFPLILFTDILITCCHAVIAAYDY